MSECPRHAAGGRSSGACVALLLSRVPGVMRRTNRKRMRAADYSTDAPSAAAPRAPTSKVAARGPDQRLYTVVLAHAAINAAAAGRQLPAQKPTCAESRLRERVGRAGGPCPARGRRAPARAGAICCCSAHAAVSSCLSWHSGGSCGAVCCSVWRWIARAQGVSERAEISTAASNRQVQAPAMQRSGRRKQQPRSTPETPLQGYSQPADAGVARWQEHVLNFNGQIIEQARVHVIGHSLQ